VSAHDAVLALARDLVEEISAGRALELAAMAPGQPAQPGLPAKPEPPKKGAAAIHPELGGYMQSLPGDTISGHAYAHMQPPAPPGQPAAPPIAGP
jgi:hypothetical protein